MEVLMGHICNFDQIALNLRDFISHDPLYVKQQEVH